MIDSKPYKVCYTEKPLTEFSKDSQLKSGISNRCKACDKIKNSKRSGNKGFTWEDVKALTLTPEEEFSDLFGNCNIWAKGKLVMKKGVVIDEEWYRGKLERLRRGKE